MPGTMFAGLEMRIWVPLSLDQDQDLVIDPEAAPSHVFVYSVNGYGERTLLTQTKWNPKELQRHDRT